MVKGKKGNVTLYVGMMVAAIVLILIASILAPMGVLFNAEMFQAGEQIMMKANASVSEIHDDGVRNSVLGTVDSAYDAAEYNMETNANFFKYSWVFVLVLVGIMGFLYARTLVEYSQPGRLV